MVSIIIPVFNGENTLEECINSILKQTYTDWEAIFVDDGSSDHSGSLCDTAAASDKRIRSIHQKNGGVSSARNAGIKLARGDSLFFLDCDDLITSDALQYLVSIQKRFSPDIIYGGIGTEKFFRKSLKRQGGENDNDDKLVRVYHNRNDFEKDYSALFISFQIHHAAGSLYKSSYVKDSISFNEKMTLGEDLDFNLHVLENVSTVAVCQKIVYFYRKSSDDQATMRYDPDKFGKARDVFHMAVDGAKKLFGQSYRGRAESSVYAGDILRGIQRQAFHDVRTGCANRRTSVNTILRWTRQDEFQKAVRNMYVGNLTYGAVYIAFLMHLERFAYYFFVIDAKVHNHNKKQ